MQSKEETINYFARSLRDNQKIGIKSRDRRYHFYVVGKTGVGKSTLLENMVVSDIRNGKGVGLVDPHGDLSQRILDFIPSHRINQTIYFNPADIDWPIAFNLLENKNDAATHLIASSLVSVFKKTWIDSWGPRLEHLIRNVVLALLECPSSTLISANAILTNQKYRQRVVDRIKDPIVKSFWQDEFANYPDRFLREVIAPLQNKLGALLSNRAVRNIVGQKKSSFDIENIINEKKIFIANLSKGLIGEDASRLLGTMLVIKLQLGAMAQAKKSEEERKDFYLYIDEFHNFSTPSFIDILSEARKYRLNLILAHQYLGQLEPEIKNAVLGNVGTIVVFRIGAEDALELESEFKPNYGWLDLVSLSPYEIFYKLMVDGKTQRPYPADTLSPTSDKLKANSCSKIINYSRNKYCAPRNKVEDKISNWLKNPAL